MLEGCERFEYRREQEMMIYPERYFQVGMRANKKDFEYLTACIDYKDLGGMVDTKLHTGVAHNISKGAKLKFKGKLILAYNIIRFCTEECEYMPMDDVVGNVFIQTISTRHADPNYIESLNPVMYIYTTYIDKFGNTWSLLNEAGDVILTKVGTKDFWIYDYVDNNVKIINDYNYDFYKLWVDKGEKVKQVYYEEILKLRGEL